jgi:predicted AlkP superfamily phosphohydrolase/phosphomutase
MLLIIGLDGATWDLLDPWIERGWLPNLGRIRRRGTWGPLRSTMPPATLPSWTTFMTGMNPGRHGIFDFTRRELGTYSVQFVNASFRKSRTIWKHLSDAGRRVCVLGVPGTYPPEPLNGCMISGFDTPVTTRADASFVAPPTLAPMVMAMGGFPFADFQEFRVGKAWYRKALAALLRGIEIKTRLAKALFERQCWDCFMLLFGESDTVAHHFWKFHDRHSPRFDPAGALEWGDAIQRVYRALDAAIGELIAAAPGATVLVASDHGFGGAGSKAVYLNQWLRRSGWQKASRAASRWKLGSGVKRLALRTLPAGAQAWAFRLHGGSWAGRLESRARFAGIEWAGTRAFSEELNYFPSIWLNVKGRDPEGVVERVDYERVRDDVCAATSGLRDAEHGAPVVRRAWRREELYEGPWVHYAPDVVLEFNLDRGYSYTCLPSTLAPTPAAVRVLDPAEMKGGKLAGMAGSHRADGVFLLGQNQVGQGLVNGTQIADMAPAILASCGIEGPRCDGRLPGWISADTRYRPAGARDDHHREDCYSDAESEEIASRLSAMGYLQ